MKKVLAIVLAMMLVLCAVGMAENVVKIGVFEPATGANGAGGKQETLGMQYANQEADTVEIGGEEYKVELVYADNASDNTQATSAAQKLVSEGVSVVLGSYGSGVSIAGSETFKNADTPAIGVTCTNPQVTAGNSHYFRVCFLDPFQGTVLANYAFKELGVTTAYCLGELGNDYDQGLVTYFKQAFEGLGGTVFAESFPKDTQDFTSYLTNAEALNAEVFFCPVSIDYAVKIIEQASSQGKTFPILGGDTLDSNMVSNAAKGTSSGGRERDLRQRLQGLAGRGRRGADQQRRQRHHRGRHRDGLRRLLRGAGGPEGRRQHRAQGRDGGPARRDL